MPLAISCTNEQKHGVVLSPKTEAGNPSAIEAGSLVVTVQSGDGTVELVDDSNFKCVSGTALGDTVYLVEADADLGAGVKTISDTVTLTVTSPEAVNLGLGVGAIEPK